MVVLREFLYLDTDLVDQFLAQLEGGSFDEEAQRLSQSGGRELRGELGVGAPGARVSGRAGKTSGSKSEVERTVRRTPESLFAHLHDHLETEAGLQWLDALDAGIWDQLKRGEILEVETSVSVSTIARWANLADQFGPIAEVMKATGDEPDAEFQTVMQMFSMFGGMLGGGVPITARPLGAQEFALAATLSPANLRVDLDHLDGEATILAKLQRKFRDGERYTALDAIPGIGGLPKQASAEMAAALENSPEFPDMVIEAPGALISVIAIYR